MLPRRNYIEILIILAGVGAYCFGTLVPPVITSQDFWIKALLLLLLLVMVFDILTMIYWRGK
ncbi:hypothetical protein [Ligilactobacillus apodemi]|uniref:hypothetical protein n=1 Tax=Ligilactobacillus apodemi TaxID=307126 RepID=UPI000469797C|nr:hypothetical protein [Ligilactobacillus apodemi]MCR1901846.1 hypothetical protein [Ligilactobacillus apodemi]